MRAPDRELAFASVQATPRQAAPHRALQMQLYGGERGDVNALCLVARFQGIFAIKILLRARLLAVPWTVENSTDRLSILDLRYEFVAVTRLPASHRVASRRRSLSLVITMIACPCYAVHRISLRILSLRFFGAVINAVSGLWVSLSYLIVISDRLT